MLVSLEPVVIVVMGIVILWIVLTTLLKLLKLRSKPYLDVFSLRKSDWKLLGSDIGGRKPLFLSDASLVGAPDLVASLKVGRKGFVGELKSRKFRGRIYPRERYQVILYMGLAKEKYNWNEVVGAIKFSDIQIKIPFDRSEYLRLRGLEPQLLKEKST